MWSPAPREKETTIKCPKCDKNLLIKRSCREVHMHCPHCSVDYPLNDYINQADEAMELFLENVYFDRI